MFNSLKKYWSLIKSLAGYMSVKCPVLNIFQLSILAGILFLTISGSTILNMWYDRDIDSIMKRTCRRPLPAGEIGPVEVLVLGLVLSIAGIGLAFYISWLFGLVIFAGLFFDVVIYTFLLKRRSPWSIIIGGISGGMPVLAGRVLGSGSIDWIGILLAASILFWIPTHILTFNMKYSDDYKNAGIPTIASVYGFKINGKIIVLSSFLSALSLIVSPFAIGISVGPLRFIGTMAGGMAIMATMAFFKPSEKLNFGLFKYASILMLTTMLIFFFEGF